MAPHVEITLGIGCRIQCTFCPQQLLMDKYQEKNKTNEITWSNPELMSFQTFKNCINKIPKFVDIHFSGYFEPWLNPECTNMLLYAHKKGHRISVFTTLVGMNEEDIEQFKHIPFTKFSIHLPDGQKYAKIGISEKYLTVLKKLCSSNIHHLTCMTMGDLPTKIQEVIGTNFDGEIMIDRAGNSEFGQHIQRKTGPLLCSRANKDGVNTLDQNVLLPNGDVCLCCMDYGAQYVIGNLISGDYSSLFSSKAFQEIIQKMNSENDDIMCRLCVASIPLNDKNKQNELSKKSLLESEKENIKTIEKAFYDFLFRLPNDDELQFCLNQMKKNEFSLDEITRRISESDEAKNMRRLIHLKQEK